MQIVLPGKNLFVLFSLAASKAFHVLIKKCYKMQTAIYRNKQIITKETGCNFVNSPADINSGRSQETEMVIVQIKTNNAYLSAKSPKTQIISDFKLKNLKVPWDLFLFLGQIQVCTYTTVLCEENAVAYKVPHRSASPPNNTYVCILSGQIYIC